MALRKARPEVILIQESKLDVTRRKTIRSEAKSLDMDFDFVVADGAASGLVSLWKRSTFEVVQVRKNQRFLLLFVKFDNSTVLNVVGNVYGPNNEGDILSFFLELGAELQAVTGRVILGGDFNAILNDGERQGGGVNNLGDANFKGFLENWKLVDLPLRNRAFTWHSTRNQGLWIKIDRWLLNDEAI